MKIVKQREKVEIRTLSQTKLNGYYAFMKFDLLNLKKNKENRNRRSRGSAPEEAVIK